MNPRLALRMGTLLAAVVFGFYALGNWMGGQTGARSLDWYEAHESELWGPLRTGSLTLAGADAVLGVGQLWMISADGQPLLVSRYQLRSDDNVWRLQGVVSLSEGQLASLVQAQAWVPGTADQAVSKAVASGLSGHRLERLSMIPEEPVEVRYIHGTFGNPDMRLEVRPGDEAWIFGRAGAVVAVTGDQAHSIMFGLRPQ
jgi:hypothetical protein